MCDLKGKVVLVSGAGQGIGARTVEVLAEVGAVVIVTGRTDAQSSSESGRQGTRRISGIWT
jgi:NAD(P)-dependent dehydrogenase (short-subunit alcohol dehydrogenase family)